MFQFTQNAALYVAVGAGSAGRYAAGDIEKGANCSVELAGACSC